jgi:hypothetical protein
MEYVIDDGKTVVCPECFVYNHFDEPVKDGQIVLCQACRLRLKIVKQGDSLGVEILRDAKGEEDKTW